MQHFFLQYVKGTPKHDILRTIVCEGWEWHFSIDSLGLAEDLARFLRYKTIAIKKTSSL